MNFPLLLITTFAFVNAQHDENAIIHAEMNKDLSKLNVDSQPSASHHYNYNPWQVATSPRPSRFATKDEALQRLKEIISRKNSEHSFTSTAKMDHGRSRQLDRAMIPAPLLRYYKDAKETTKQMEDRMDSMEGIPAPLLAGGAYR